MYRRLPADTAAALHPRVLTPTLQIILPHVQPETALYFNRIRRLRHFRINSGAAICRAEYLRLTEYVTM